MNKKIKTKTIFFLFLIILNISCNNRDDSERVYVLIGVSNNVDGLEREAPIFIGDKQVGIVEDLKIVENDIHIIMRFDSLSRIPIGSKFLIFSHNILGERAVSVDTSSGEKTRFYRFSEEVPVLNQNTTETIHVIEGN